MQTSEGMPHRVAAAVGDYGERMAERYLRDQGLEILARNWRCALGEIDIVARDGGCLVVCEVKTRRGVAFGGPIQAVTLRKLARADWLPRGCTSARAMRPGHTSLTCGLMSSGWPDRAAALA